METKKSKSSKRKKTSVTEPFTILVMGVDSNDDEIDDWGLGDTIILITFNPKTLNATIFSIPRDTYVPIAWRKNAENKINASYELHIASSEELPKVVGMQEDVANSKVVKKFISANNNNSNN